MCTEKNVIKSMKGSWVCLSIVLLNAGTNIDCKHYCSTFFKRRAYTYTYLYIYICICINKTSTTITHHICAVSSLKLPLIFLFSPHLVSSLRCLLLFLRMQKHSKCVFGCGCVCSPCIVVYCCIISSCKICESAFIHFVCWFDGCVLEHVFTSSFHPVEIE